MAWRKKSPHIRNRIAAVVRAKKGSCRAREQPWDQEQEKDAAIIGSSAPRRR